MSPKEFESLRDSGACFICRRPRHMARECPNNSRRKEDNGEWRPTLVKKEVLNREMPIADEDESEAEPSTYHPVPSIRIPVKVKKISMEALIDCGAEGDFILERVVKEKKLPTVPIKPIRVGQALQGSKRTIVNRKVRSHIYLTNRDYTSKKEVDLLVAPLNMDMTLGMPMLQQEGMVIDAANHDIITLEMEAEIKNKSVQVGCEILNVTTRDPTEIRPTQQETSVASRNHADPTRTTPTQQKSSSAGMAQADAPTITPEAAKKHHAERIKEFSEVFNHKAPTLNSHNRPKDAPYHRIQLKDPNKSIHGRMFALPEWHMNWMIEFIEHHLLAGHI